MCENDQEGPVEMEAFERVFRDNLTPECVAVVIAYLQPVASRHATSDKQRAAFRQAEWLVDTMLKMLGLNEFNRLAEELGL